MKHLEHALLGKNRFGKYILLLFIVLIAGSTIGSIPLIAVMIVKNFSSGNIDSITNGNYMDLAAYGISNNLGLILMLFSFVAIFFIFVALIKPMFGTTLNETINGRNYIRWNKIWTGIMVWGTLLFISFAISVYTSSPEELEFRFNPGAFLVLLLIVVTILPFQTSIEEILTRGFLAQGVARWTKSRWWALIIPSVFFALMHATNPEVMKFGFWLSMPNYLMMGLMLGLISILDDGIELALGIHFINNAFSAIFIIHQDSVLQTDALLMMHDVDPVASLVETVILTTIAVIALWRIYKWDLGIMNRKVKIETPEIPNLSSTILDV